MLGCKAALKTQMGDRWNWKLSTQTCKRDLNVCISYIHAHIHTLRTCPTNTSCIHIPPTHLIYISHVHFPYPYPISTSHRQPFRAAGRDNHPVAGRKPDTSLFFFFFFPYFKGDLQRVQRGWNQSKHFWVLNSYARASKLPFAELEVLFLSFQRDHFPWFCRSCAILQRSSHTVRCHNMGLLLKHS